MTTIETEPASMMQILGPNKNRNPCGMSFPEKIETNRENGTIYHRPVFPDHQQPENHTTMPQSILPRSNHPNKVVLLDRDGVLNRDRHDYVRTVAQLLIFPGIPAAVARLNQAAVAKGLIHPETLTAIHAKLSAAITAGGGRIDAIYHCPHRNEDLCGCRKPAPGMIIRAQQEWRFDPAQTWMVGDTKRDLDAARAAGCQAALVLTGHNQKNAETVSWGAPIFADLTAFVDFLLAAD